jgi:excisionase family DNA binding protein
LVKARSDLPGKEPVQEPPRLSVNRARDRGDDDPEPPVENTRPQNWSDDIPAWALVSTASAARPINRTTTGTTSADSNLQVDSNGCSSRFELSRPLGSILGRHQLGPLLTIAEAAAILNVSGRTVRRLIASKAIPAVWIGRSVRLRPRDIERLIAKGLVCND